MSVRCKVCEIVIGLKERGSTQKRNDKGGDVLEHVLQAYVKLTQLVGDSRLYLGRLSFKEGKVEGRT